MIYGVSWPSRALVMLQLCLIMLRMLGWSGNVCRRPISALGSIRHIFNNKNNYTYITVVYSLFLLISLIVNILGLFIFGQQLFLSSFTFILLWLTTRFWLISYKEFFAKDWGYIVNILIVNITYPILSLLLRNIEIVTHIFRPITLMARLWVNIWVGHCLLSIVSFGWMLRFLHWKGCFSQILIWSILQGGLTLYELAVALLQSLVVVYLSYLYYKDNYEATLPASTH